MTRTPDTDADYWAVIFTAQRDGGDEAAYAATAARMIELAAEMPGFLGVESTSNTDGSGITVSYWSTEENLLAWRAVAEHAAAQSRGRSEWYSSYTTRIARVGREYTYQRD